MGQKLALRVRKLLFGAILRQEVGWFDRENNNSGSLSSLLSTEATYVKGAVADVIGLMLQNITTLAFGYLLALVYDWRMALLVTGILPLLVISELVQIQYNLKHSMGSDGVDSHYAAANQAASESITAVRVVQSYNLQPSVMKRYREAMRTVDKQMLGRALAIGVAAGFAGFMMFATCEL